MTEKNPGEKIRVLVVDDSAMVRQLLAELLSADPSLEVVGTAADPFIAREKIKQLKPHVLTLDVEMPRMDGLTFLENLMRLHPLPVVMVSSLTEKGAEVTMDALALGAFDFVTKPKLDVERGLRDYGDMLVEKVKAAAKAQVRPRAAAPAPKLGSEAVLARAAPTRFRTTDRLLAIGASAGGTEAVRVVLERMPPDAPGIVITQHIPAGFSRAFAQRLDRHSAMSVCEAEDGQEIRQGHAYVAPGGMHLLVKRDGARWRCVLNDGPPVSRHKPSVDVLMRSVAQEVGVNAVGCILTGMGDDGAKGLRELREAGAPTFVQDEASCVVFGMPGAAIKAGAADEQVPIEKVAERLLKLASDTQAKPRSVDIA